MLREVSTLTVPSKQEAQVVTAYETFGWTLASRRSSPEGETVRLTLERDQSRQTADLMALERRYHALQDPKRPPGYRKVRLLAPQGALSMGFGLLVFSFTGAAEVLIGGLLLGGSLLGIGSIWQGKYRRWDTLCRKNQQEREELLHQARALKNNGVYK